MGPAFKSPVSCCVNQLTGPATTVHALLLTDTARGHFCWEHFLFSMVDGHFRGLCAPGEQACSIFLIEYLCQTPALPNSRLK